jgi:hypothetical protein
MVDGLLPIASAICRLVHPSRARVALKIDPFFLVLVSITRILHNATYMQIGHKQF